MKRLFAYTSAVAIACTLLASIPASAQVGHVLNGVGPIDQGMSGAGMAAPQDALTALHWNPASVFGVPGRSLDISLQVMKPGGGLTSSVDAGAFGALPDDTQFPWQNLSGTTDSEAGPFPIPSIGYLAATEGSRFAYGFSAFGVGGFGVDYAASPANLMQGTLPENPLLSPQQAEAGIGFGALSSTFMLLQLSPTVAYKITPDIWVGAAPTLNVAMLELSVFPGTAPQMFDSPMGMLALYPDAPASWATGFGFQAGIHARTDVGLSGGLSFKSKQAFQDFEFSPTTPGASDYTFRLDYPMVLSGAVAYSGIKGLLLAADVRYLDFANATGFMEYGFDQTGAVQGFGWESVTVVALGAQYEISPGLPLRVGYSFNGCPIDEDGAFFNTPAPAIITRHVSGGGSYQVTDHVKASLSVQIGLTHEMAGSWMTINPENGSTVEIQNTSVTNELSTFTVIGGVSISL